jgi:hypothetical protein
MEVACDPRGGFPEVNDGRASMSPRVNVVWHNNQILRGGSQRSAAARVCDLWALMDAVSARHCVGMSVLDVSACRTARLAVVPSAHSTRPPASWHAGISSPP